MSKQRYDIDETWVQRYREGTLSEEERAWLQAHPFEAEALEGLAQNPQWSQDVSELQQKLRDRTTKQISLWVVYGRYAAALALLITTGWIVYRLVDREDVITQSTSVTRVEEPGPASERIASMPSAPGKITSEDANLNSDESPLALLQRSVEAVPIPEKPAVTMPSAVSSPVLEEGMRQADEEEIREQQAVEADYSLAAPLSIQEGRSFQAKSATPTPPEQLGLHVTGSVFSAEDRAPLPGVNVIVKGTRVGTITDINGYFSVLIPDSSEATLVFSFIGFVPEEVAVDQQDSLTVALQEDEQALSEVVETAYDREKDAVSQAAYPLPSKKAFREYLQDQLRYPEAARQQGVEGTVKVRFTVEVDGQLTDFQIEKSLGYGCDEEAIRLIQEGPDWQPALRNGQPQPQEVTVKVRFKQP